MAFAEATRDVFYGMAVAMAIAFVIALKFMPDGQSRRRRSPRGRAAGRLTTAAADAGTFGRVKRPRRLLVLLSALLLLRAGARRGARGVAGPRVRGRRTGGEVRPDRRAAQENDPPCETSAEQYQPTRWKRCSATRRWSCSTSPTAEAADDPPRADRQGHRRAARRLVPEPRRARARRHLRLRQGVREADRRRQGARRHLRPHRPRKGPLRVRPPVLVLLVLQPVQRPARG